MAKNRAQYQGNERLNHTPALLEKPPMRELLRELQQPQSPPIFIPVSNRLLTYRDKYNKLTSGVLNNVIEGEDPESYTP
jgi:hypothetical protein